MHAGKSLNTLTLLTIALGAGWHGLGLAQVYVGTAQDSGAVVLSNFQTEATPQLLLAPENARTQAPVMGITNPVPTSLKVPARADHLREVIEAVASDVEIAPELIRAVMAAESNFNPKAVSPKGAIGLMQLMPSTARRFGVSDPFVIRDNIFAGASYLKWLMTFFKGDLELVLAAYNAGEQAVVRAGLKIPKYPETQAYVRRIMADLRSSDALPL